MLTKPCLFWSLWKCNDSEKRTYANKIIFYLNLMKMFKLGSKNGWCIQLHSIYCTFFNFLPHCVVCGRQYWFAVLVWEQLGPKGLLQQQLNAINACLTFFPSSWARTCDYFFRYRHLELWSIKLKIEDLHTFLYRMSFMITSSKNLRWKVKSERVKCLGIS